MKYNFKNSTIGDACLLVTDGSHFSPKSVEHGEYMVSVKDFTPYGFDFDNCRQISANDYEKLKKSGCIPQYEDILIGKDGARYFEDIVVYRQTEQPALLSSIAILRCNTNELLPDYLYYMMINPAFKQNVRDNYGSGSAIPRIILKDFKRMPISYPSIKVQQRIISILRGIDAKIELNSKINANLQQQAQAIFKSWFVDFAPFQAGEFVESELGPIPKGWRVGRLADVCSYGKDKITVSELTPENYFSTENMLANKGGYTSAASLPNVLQTTRCVPGDTLISNIRPYFKKIVYCTMKAGCSTDVLCLRPKHSKYNTYLYNLAYSDAFFDYMVAGSKGTKMPRGDKQQIMSYSFMLPPDEVIEKFHEFADAVLKKIWVASEENKKLTGLRDSLLPKLMSGELSLNEEVGS